MVGIQRRPHWGGDFEWNSEGSERIIHVWIHGGKGCSLRQQRCQRSCGKNVLGIKRNDKPAWLDMSEQGRQWEIVR